MNRQSPLLKICSVDICCCSVALSCVQLCNPLDCKEIQPVYPKEISSEYSLDGLMLKLKLQYFGHLMQRPDSFEKALMLGKIEGGRRRGWRRMRWLYMWVYTKYMKNNYEIKHEINNCRYLWRHHMKEWKETHVFSKYSLYYPLWPRIG